MYLYTVNFLFIRQQTKVLIYIRSLTFVSTSFNNIETQVI